MSISIGDTPAQVLADLLKKLHSLDPHELSAAELAFILDEARARL